MKGADHRVLVTGASGFLGRPCLEILAARGWQVDAVSRQPPTPNESLGQSLCDAVTWWQADLLDSAQVAALIDRVRPSYLLHLAWASGRDGFRDGMENYRWVASSLELVRHFAEAGGRRAVFVGTGAEYDWRDGLCSEASTPLAPASTYGLCKHVFSRLVERYFAQSPQLDGAWARLFFLYGPGEDDYRLLPSVVSRLLRGEAAECTFDRLRRDYLFVDDAARGLVDVLESEIVGPINIASGEAIALGELVGRAAEMLDRRDLLRLGGQPSGEHPAPLVVADIERARLELGWQPRIGPGEGLEKTLAWWRLQLARSTEGSS